MRTKTSLIFLFLATPSFTFLTFGCDKDEPETTGTVTINGIEFDVDYTMYTWENLPADVVYERQAKQSYTNSKGATHSYEAVYVSSGNLNWYQAAYLAADAGGYLTCPTDAEENTFIFSLIADAKYFWNFPEATGAADHYEISIGPWLGGYQPDGSEEPDGGWIWLCGETMSYTNWAQNLDDGVTDKDTQPNDSGDNENGQRVMAFGEMNIPVATWGAFWIM